MSAPAHEVATAQPEPDAIAIKVNNVSKVYGLWSSPKARLAHPLLNLAAQMLPLPRIRRSVEHRTRHMFREFHALQDISLEIKKGESWGFIGVNGSGKSTLLKIISGNLRPSRGSVEVDGKVAILDYGAGFNGEFTGRENVYLKASILGLTRRQVDERFGSIVEFADIGQFIDQPVKTYSSGMQARLGFAVMAHVDADIMITDEALAVGDAFFVQKCMAHIRSFLKRGTFLFVSHATGDVISLCEKAVWIDKGIIRSIGKAKDVVSKYLSENEIRQGKAYLQRDEVPSNILVEEKPTQVASSTRLEQPTISAIRIAKPPKQFRDPRLELINRTQWRNDIHIPQFGNASSSHGVGGAEIIETVLVDEDGAIFSSIIGGDSVQVQITVHACRNLKSPIVGFQVQDRLGQTLFGDNTYITTIHQPVEIFAGELFMAKFRFQMPLLPVGDYAIRAAVAEGKDTDAAMLHVVEASLVFRSVASAARYGLVGIPMESIELSKVSSPDSAAP